MEVLEEAFRVGCSAGIFIEGDQRSAIQLVVRLNETEADPQPEIWKDRMDTYDI